MKQKLIVLAGLTLLISLLAQYWPQAEKDEQVSQVTPARTSAPASSQLPFAVSDRQAITVQIGQKQLTAEAVITSESISQGLSGRSEIGYDGMLFIFAEPKTPSFWMKEMQFPLDFIWIDQGKVIDLTENVPPPEPGQALAELPTYTPRIPVTFVLEVPAGSVQEWGVQMGDLVTFQP